MVIAGTINTTRFIYIKRFFCLYRILLLKTVVTTDNQTSLSMVSVRDTLKRELQLLLKSFSYPGITLEVGKTRLDLKGIHKDLSSFVEVESSGIITNRMIYDYPKRDVFFDSFILKSPLPDITIDTVISDLHQLITLTKSLFDKLLAYVQSPTDSELTLEKCIRYTNILELLDATFCVLEEGDQVFRDDMGV